jgi:hypothetical protein
MGQRLMVYDATWEGRRWVQPFLTSTWMVGGRAWRLIGRFDGVLGARSWAEALQWLGDRKETIDHVEYWGHGRWGQLKIGKDTLDASAFRDPAEPRRPLVQRFADRLQPESLVWFRTCETFGRARGQDFACTVTESLGCRAAGYTYVIGHLQSGLHSLAPGARPHWSEREGLPEGVDDPKVAQWSHWKAPNTVTFLAGRVPDGF